MLNLNRLKMLAELNRLGSLAQVAQVMAYSPSAISQQLGVLEKETGVQLTQAVGRGVRLTPEGISLASHAEAVLRRLEVAEAELAHAVSSTFTVRLGSFQTAMLTIISDVIKKLDTQSPNVHLEFTWCEVRESYESLLSHDFEMICGEEFAGVPDPEFRGCERTVLLKDRMLVVAPQEQKNTALPTAPQRLSDFADANWCLDPAGSAAGEWERNLCRAAGFEPRVRFDTPDPLLQSHLVREGFAVAFLPALMATAHLGGTQQLALPLSQQRTVYTAVREGSAQHPALVATRQAFEEAARLNVPPSFERTIDIS